MNALDENTAVQRAPRQSHVTGRHVHRSALWVTAVAGLSLLVSVLSLWCSEQVKNDAADIGRCAVVAAHLDALSGVRGTAELALNEEPTRQEALRLRRELSVAKAELSAHARAKSCLDKQEQRRLEATIDVIKEALQVVGSLGAPAATQSPSRPTGPSLPAAPSPEDTIPRGPARPHPSKTARLPATAWKPPNTGNTAKAPLQHAVCP